MNEPNYEQNNGNNKDTSKFSAEKEIPNAHNSKKKLIIIISCALCLILILSVLIFVLSNKEDEGNERETFPPLSLSQLYETKEEGFDIMEYDKYLIRNRLVMLYDIQSGVTVSIDDVTYKNHGDGVTLMYEMIDAIIAGDSDAYNSMVTEEVGHYDSFTQQQLYDIRITKESQTVKEDQNGSYTEYVFTLEYKIQENNGTYKNNLLSDTSRPHTIIINDSTGNLLVMDIIDEPKQVKQ